MAEGNSALFLCCIPCCNIDKLRPIYAHYQMKQLLQISNFKEEDEDSLVTLALLKTAMYVRKVLMLFCFQIYALLGTMLGLET